MCIRDSHVVAEQIDVADHAVAAHPLLGLPDQVDHDLGAGPILGEQVGQGVALGRGVLLSLIHI